MGHPVVKGDFNYPDNNWETNSAANGRLNRFVVCLADNFILQIMENKNEKYKKWKKEHITRTEKQQLAQICKNEVRKPTAQNELRHAPYPKNNNKKSFFHILLLRKLVRHSRPFYALF